MSKYPGARPGGDATLDCDRTEASLRLVVDKIPALVHTALPDGNLDFFNQPWMDFVGLPMERLLGWGWTSAIHPEDVDGIVGRWRACVASGENFFYECRVRRADGEYRWMAHQKVPLRDEAGGIVKWFGASIDIEDRRRAEERVVRSERELRLAIDAVPAQIIVASLDGSPPSVNRAVIEFAGLEDRDLHGTLDELVKRLLHPEDVDRLGASHRAALAAGTAFEDELRLRGRNGDFRWFLFRLVPLKDERERDRVLRWYVIGSDIHERKEAEERIVRENIALREEVEKTSMFEEIVGVSAPLRSVLAQVARVAPTDSTVLISGETGTGKELVARAIHKLSQRSGRALVSVNCAAIPPSLIASELFGHEKGAFTGALQRRQGRFEIADGGTIFLDEVGELPAESQVTLLRVLQEREFERVGGGRPIRTDVRVIAASNRNLEAAVAQGTFRADLFYRLSVFPLEIPPLRNRRADIPVLVEYFIHRYSRRTGKKICGISKASLDLLRSYEWPGNVRELQNVVERAVIVSDSETLSIDERWLSGTPPAAAPEGTEQTQAISTGEKGAIESALLDTKGRVSGPFGAAARLGVPSSTLESRIRALKIDKSRFKSLRPAPPR